MARYTVVTYEIDVLGRIWLPDIIAAQAIKLSRYDMDNLGEPTRENVEQWLCKHAGDFREIIDFRASLDEVEIPWMDEENEYAFDDYMFERNEYAFSNCVFEEENEEEENEEEENGDSMLEEDELEE